MVTVYPTPEKLGDQLADVILAGIRAAQRAGDSYVLGCPGGRSLRTTYQALGRIAGETGADLSHVILAMMDEYLWRSGDEFAYCPIDAHFSCRKFAVEEIWQVLNSQLVPQARIPRQHIWVPDPAAPAAFDARLAMFGGVDIFLLASGASDGHVAFNPPGTTLASRTRIIELAYPTRQDNVATFPQFTSVDEVPTHGVSVGLGTIVEQSKQVAMVIHGRHKKEAAQRLLAGRRFDPAWPATVIHACRQGRLLLDESAAKLLQSRHD